MTKSFLTLIALLAAGTASAQIVTESFDVGPGGYADNTDAVGQSPANSPFTGAWSGTSGDTQTQSGAGLSYNAGSININGTGGGLKQTAFSNDTIVRSSTLTDNISTAGERWFAALVSMDSFSGSTDGIGVSFDVDAGTANQNFGMGISNGNFFGFSGGGTYTGGGTFGTYTTGTTALLIGKLQVTGTGSATDEPFTIWANPTDSSSEAQLTSTAAASNTFNNSVIFGDWGSLSVQVELIGSGGGNNQILDEIFVANSLSDLNTVIVPEPSTYALLAGFVVLGLVCFRRRS